MFSYHIWFKSGNNIEGDMDGYNSQKLKEWFRRRVEIADNIPVVLIDTDGELILDYSRVEAISITPIKEGVKSVGFGN